MSSAPESVARAACANDSRLRQRHRPARTETLKPVQLLVLRTGQSRLETTGLRIDEGNDDALDSDIEQQANERATSWIFPDGFSPPPAPISIAAVHTLASKHGVHPSIVIGRLQRDGVLDWSQFRRSVPKVRPALGIS